MDLTALLVIWLVLNIACAFTLVISCFSQIEYTPADCLVYPLLIRNLRERLNVAGTIIVTVLFSIVFLPAVVVYFIGLFLLALGWLLVTLFLEVFKNKE